MSSECSGTEQHRLSIDIADDDLIIDLADDDLVVDIVCTESSQTPGILYGLNGQILMNQ